MNKKSIIHFIGNLGYFNSLFILLFPLQLLSKELPNNSIKQNDIFRNKSSIQNEKVHIKDFGAIGDGKTNNTVAFQKASAYLQNNGGTLIIDPGTYIVGKQKLSGNYLAGGSFMPEPILSFSDSKKPIIILGYDAILKAADGLKFGSFNPVTGDKDSIRGKGNESDYYAAPFIFIYAVRCDSISIKGITLDGNSGKLDIGPSFGPEGIQLPAIGIGLYSNKNVEIADCYIHHFALDGIIISWAGLKESDPIYPHTITNVKAEFNGRQGISWVGGNSLTVINSEFSSTGKGLNNGIPVVSKPSAGIDIEIENSIIRNGKFINCLVYNNSGPGVISIGYTTSNINFKKCTFIGTTNSAVYPKSEGFSFDNCTFVGMVQRIFGSQDKSKATTFTDCLFTLDSTKSPNGKVYGDTWEFYEGQNVLFKNCEFDADGKKLPTFNTPEITFLDCSFSQNSNANFNAAAFFEGTTTFIMKGNGKIDASNAHVTGTLIYNNKNVTDFKNLK
jgi:hypothetical protein